MKRLWHVLKHLMGAAALLAFACLCWVLAYYATAWVYRSFGFAPGPVAGQVLTSLVGLIFMISPMIVFGLIHQPREQAAFRSITQAIARIAKGDFSARIDLRLPPNRNHPFVKMIDSLNDMAGELDRLERLRQEFISNVSHEIGSPLTSIRGFAQALHDERLSPAERGRYLEIIELESERLAKLSDNLLKLTALESERPPVEKRAYRLDEQLRRAILSCEPQWSGKALEMEAELSPLSLVGDEALLDHVWLNLLHNAIKFTPAGGAIAVRLDSDGEGAIVDVADTGIGISPADQERIFERFFKADRARNRAAGGSGLGLALAKRIVALHGGQIGVTSAMGRGTTFRVTLPQGAKAQSKPCADAWRDRKEFP